MDMICRIRLRARIGSIDPEALLLMQQCPLWTELAFHP